MVLMATTHLSYWKHVKATPPKEQTNILPGTPELPDNYLSAIIANITVLLFGMWFLMAAYFLTLNLIFLPASLTILFGIPLLCMKLPVLLINKACMKLGMKDTADTGVLELKVMGAAAVVTFVSAVSYADFYYDPSGWWDLADRLWEMESKKLMEELGVTVEDFDPKPTDAESKNKAIKAMLSTIHKKEKEALIRQGILTSIKRTWSLR